MGGSKKTFPAHVAGNPAVSKEAIEQLTPGHVRMKAMVQNPEAGFPLCNLGNKLVRVVNGNDLDPATSLYFGYRANVKVGGQFIR